MLAVAPAVRSEGIMPRSCSPLSPPEVPTLPSSSHPCSLPHARHYRPLHPHHLLTLFGIIWWILAKVSALARTLPPLELHGGDLHKQSHERRLVQ